MIQDILNIINIHPKRLINIYQFGSTVYLTNNKDSDKDFVVIAKSSITDKEFKTDLYNIHLLSEDRFRLGLKNHNIRDIECVMAPDWAKLVINKQIDFEVNKPSLRHFISHSNSINWVKCKKKLAQGDYYIGTKSLFHSMRVVNFGIQLATIGKIIDFSCSNWIWEEINSKKWTWEELDTRWKPYNNEIMHDFRIKCSKK
jgi:hypothetical protein